jgi:aminotransferase
MLDTVGVRYFKPQGAYYVFCNVADFGFKTDLDFTHYLLKDVGVAVVPGSSFFSQPELGRKFVRFCFSKRPETLDAAGQRLARLGQTLRLSL